MGGTAEGMDRRKLSLSGLQRLAEARLGCGRERARLGLSLPMWLIRMTAESLADGSKLGAVPRAPLADQKMEAHPDPRADRKRTIHPFRQELGHLLAVGRYSAEQPGHDPDFLFLIHVISTRSNWHDELRLSHMRKLHDPTRERSTRG